jgi:hypothetical protein
MPFLSRFFSFWKNLLRRRQVERDLNDELEAYVDELANRRIQAGVSPETAREEALHELGGMDRIKALVRQQRIGMRRFQLFAVVMSVGLVAFIAGATFSSSIGLKSPDKSASQPASQVVPESISAPRAKEVVMEGRLVDKETGLPISNVKVSLEPGPLLTHYTHTDSTGRFQFPNPPSQGYRLTAGAQSWRVDGFVIPAPFQNSVLPPWDNFHLSIPTSVAVTSKQGTPVEGERLDFKGAVSDKKLKKMPEVRRFHYSTSVLELRASNFKPAQP